ncbi:MAG: ATP-binding protein [Thermodesulfobacteriota bacterium]
MFRKATRCRNRLRMGIVGPSGSGKTYSALRIATELGSRVALIDTEHGTSAAYADIFDFDMMELDSFHPDRYVEAIHHAQREEYDVLIVDSLSHAWSGKDGALDLVDQAAKRSKTHSAAPAWRLVTPLHNALVETILQSQLHCIVTLRARTKYILEQDDKGKSQVKKVGLEAVQREGLEYELDVVGDLDLDNNLVISKTRCPDLHKRVFHEPGADLACILSRWLSRSNPESKPSDQGASGPTGGNGGALSSLALATRALFDDNRIDEHGRKAAFKAIRDEFRIEKLEDIAQDQYERYWNFVTHRILPAVKAIPANGA